MKKYREIKGDLIKLAREGKFEVITHGCNCMCSMGSGIAPQMAKAFSCHLFKMEGYKDVNKLGNIDYEYMTTDKDTDIIVINSYTQYAPGSNPIKPNEPSLDYQALVLCLRKINFLFQGKTIGLPMIGCGLAGGNWSIVKQIIQEELKDMDVTVVIWEKK